LLDAGTAPHEKGVMAGARTQPAGALPRAARSRSLRAALAVLALATLSFALWRGEVEYIKGWTGLNWLHGYPWSALPICVLVAASTLIPVAVAVPLSRERSLIFLAVVTVVGWASFEIARRWFYVDNSWLIAFHQRPDPEYFIFSPLLSIVLTTVGVQQAMHHLLVPIPTWTVGFFLVAVLLIVPVSLLAIQIVPVYIYRDFIHTIKSGYTAFFTNILLGIAAALATRFRRGTTKP
jgi:hypothetical protein